MAEENAIKLNSGKISCTVFPFGATLQSLTVPDRNGRPTDVVLGYDTPEGYANDGGSYLGALVGRYANRIAGSQFTLDGIQFRLDSNEGCNQLHSGSGCFGKRLWKIGKRTDSSVTLELFSPDGEAGFPGNLTVHVSYTLEASALEIDYTAESDARTPCSMTSHAYFNLSGHQAGLISDHSLRLWADCYTPVNGEMIPDGTVESVLGTPLDFSAMKPILQRIDSDYGPLKESHGYDFNYVLLGEPGQLRPAAEAISETTGIRMTVRTTSPGIQLYTANFLSVQNGKDGARYDPRSAFCLETQFYPDSPNHPNFPDSVIGPGKPYHEKTVFSFSLE